MKYLHGVDKQFYYKLVLMWMHRLILFLTHPLTWEPFGLEAQPILMPTEHCFEIQIYLEGGQRNWT